MPNKESYGYDDISIETMNIAIPFISSPLARVINNSFSKGIVPDSTKVAKVLPLFKSGDQTLLSNYRPISLLPSFSKIFERLVYNRLISYLNKNNILHDYQFGFRSNHDTAMAVTEMVDKIAEAIDSKKISLGIFIDLSKAFDTINHNILIQKLSFYGIRGLSLEWFKSYLSDRSQFVCYSNAKSTVQKITCGVPQGSILGPLLFLLYVNDISNISKILHFVLFADDTNYFCPTIILLNCFKVLIRNLNISPTGFCVIDFLSISQKVILLFSQVQKLNSSSVT